ncbi:MAG: hypothetical protein E7420_01875 [Ruminococcaceae bacterium]|nr:hypothetical protein [Oscillospiraceae bacterium]
MKRIVCIILMFVVMLGCIPVFASPTSSTDLVGSLIDNDDTVPKSELDWDTLVEEFLAAAQVEPESVAMGYYNTVTGEEHYFRGDVLMTGGSISKLPLTMYHSEMLYNGEISWDTTFNGYDYKSLLHSVICNSSNDMAAILVSAIGTDSEFRRAICPYLGVDPDAIDKRFFILNDFTAQQMIHCLKMLYSEPERFPGVIDHMLHATPGEYFEQIVDNYEVGQKYGWYIEGNNNFISCVGFVEMEDPILITILTENCRPGKKILGDFCALMCEYTENNTAVRKAAEEEALRKEEAEQAAHQAALDKLAQQEAEAEAAKKAEEEKAAQEAAFLKETQANASNALRFLACLLGCALLAVALGLVARLKKKPADSNAAPNIARISVSVILGLVSVIAIVATILISIFAVNSKPVILSEGADPSGKAEQFLSLVLSGESSEAEKLLIGDSKLGLDSKPQDKLGAMLYDALQDSFSYEVSSECVSESINASQNFTVTYLDIPSLTALQQEATNARLAEYVEAAVRAEEVLAEDGSYLPEVAMRALEEVTLELLENVEDHYVEREITINMQYISGEWMVVADASLFAILSGNTAY